MIELTDEERVAAAQAKRDATKAAHDAAFTKQLAPDLEALAALEEAHGFERVQSIALRGWKKDEGAATMVVVRLPGAKDPVYRRFEAMVAKAKQDTDDAIKAGNQLADSCIVYPEPGSDLLKATLELAAGIRGVIALQIVKTVQGKAEKEKKD